MQADVCSNFVHEIRFVILLIYIILLIYFYPGFIIKRLKCNKDMISIRMEINIPWIITSISPDLFGKVSFYFVIQNNVT